jgi:RNA polymerase sigma factor (TIGR02999 family)
MDDPNDELSRLLQRWSGGSAVARDRLIEAAYDELKLIARKLMAREASDSLLQPTALVHEAYLKLDRSERVDCQNQVHFLSIAARAMRQVLVDHGRRRQTEKRKLGHRVTLVADLEGAHHEVDVLQLDQALDRLVAAQPEAGQHYRTALLRWFDRQRNQRPDEPFLGHGRA